MRSWGQNPPRAPCPSSSIGRSTAVLTPRICGFEPRLGYAVKFLERCQSLVYRGALLRRRPPPGGPWVQIPSSPHHPLRPAAAGYPVARGLPPVASSAGCRPPLGFASPGIFTLGAPGCPSLGDAREADWAGFETRRGAILRGSESHSLRPWKVGREAYCARPESGAGSPPRRFKSCTFRSCLLGVPTRQACSAPVGSGWVPNRHEVRVLDTPPCPRRLIGQGRWPFKPVIAGSSPVEGT